MLCLFGFKTRAEANIEMQQCKLSLLTIVQPCDFDWLTSSNNPPQCDVTPFVHAAVLQGLYEDGWIKAFTRRAWIWRTQKTRATHTYQGFMCESVINDLNCDQCLFLEHKTSLQSSFSVPFSFWSCLSCTS